MTEEQLLLRNLRDVGCDDAVIAQYFKLREAGKKTEQMQLLSVHRALLLDQGHVSQQTIDCLDDLIYTTTKK